jgi:hypothetical protein
MKRFALLLVGVWLVPYAVSNAETIQPVKAAVIRSTGTMFLGQTIWSDLNSGWSNFGDTPVNIDYTSLAGYGWGLPQIRATGADVLIFSVPGFLGYTAAEIAAVKQYVEEGHGLIITYDDFLGERKALAPLVGLSESISLGTGTATDPFWLAPSIPDHPILHNVTQPYVSGVRTAALFYGSPPWSAVQGTIVAELLNDVVSPMPAIVVNETDDFRGLYFSYYIENKSGGANQQDMQVFYNGLLWAPEPGTALLLLGGAILVVRRRLNRRA